MRSLATLALLIVAPSAFAQTKELQDALDAKLATLRYVKSLHDPATGGYMPTPTAPAPSLRATNAGLKAWTYLNGPVADRPDVTKTVTFVVSCYDPKTGGFADTPGGAVDVTTTAVGVMAAVEAKVPKEKFARSMTYLGANAKTFEEVRLGAAAVEAWGVAGSPVTLDPWLAVVAAESARPRPTSADGSARNVASWAAMYLRLGRPLPTPGDVRDVLRTGQRADGAWGKAGETGSDLESTYRVMRAFHLLREPPKDPAGLRAFVRSCRNADGGSGVTPGGPSGAAGTYYAAVVTAWLDKLDPKGR